MSLNKVNYVNDSTVITAENLNEIQDAILENESAIKKKVESSELTSAVNSALEDAKESGEFDGEKGKPGNGIKSVALNADYTLSITLDDGTVYTTPSIRGAAGKDGEDGKDGKDGENGTDGVGIASIEQTTTSTVDGGNNVFTVRLTNGTSATFTVKNGNKGKDGEDGKDGTSVSISAVSESTEDGGSNVVTFSDGTKLTVKNGNKGKDGSDGVGIASIKQTTTSTADGGNNVFTVALTNGTSAPFTVKNGNKGKDGKDGSDYSFDPTVYDLPVLYLTGDISPIKVNKDNEVSLSYVYGERSGTCTLKGQGSSSYNMAKEFIDNGKAGKFNYTIKFDNAFEAKDGWGAQKKYCLKANWIDHSHSRNVVSCKLWGMSVKSRSTVPTELVNLPNGGAIDGFPIVIVVNGEFHGLYTFNIPKDGWMLGLVEDATKTQAIFSAHQHSDATQFKGTLKGDESDFELEFISDKNNTAWATASLNRLINACVNSYGGDLDTEVAKYIDWDSAIDYYIHCVVEKGSDAVDKNFLLATFDGVKWFFTNYDRDTICGLAWDGSALNRPVSDVKFTDCKNTSRIFELIYRFKTDALKARYQQLRANILSESRINQIYENFAWAIPSPVALEDVKKYPTIRGSFVNGVDQICRWMRQRLDACDQWISELPAQEIPVEPDTPVEIKNWVEYAVDTDGSLYNGCGYKDGVRLSSSGDVSSDTSSPVANSTTVGFMPFKNTDVIRMKGATCLEAFNNYGLHTYLNLYDSNKAFIGGGSKGISDLDTTSQLSMVYDETTGVTTFQIIDPDGSTGAFRSAAKQASYFRINAYGKGADLIITINQEIPL